MYDIVVLGAGVVGLSTARCIQKALPDRKVTIIADKFTQDTTSDGAAGIFRMTLGLTPVLSVDRYRKWCEDSFCWFHHLNTDYDPSYTGVQRLSGYQFSDPNEEYPVYHNIIYDFREMTERELRSFPGNRKYGWKFTTLMTEGRRYLPFLTEQFLSHGGTTERRTIQNIDEFAGSCSCLVNCTGMGSVQLFNDTDMFVVRGHLIRVRAPWVKHFCVADGGNTYIYPGQDNVVLGGTRQEGQHNTTLDDSEETFDDILQRCEQVMPSIKNAEVDRKWVGLRPHRKHIRIEAETKRFGPNQLKIVHNYGHGANGVGLSWGTALEAAQLVKNAIGYVSAVSKL